MGRKEAIEVLKFLLQCSYVDEFLPEENEALKMAINALELLTSYEHTMVKLLKIIKENGEG